MYVTNLAHLRCLGSPCAQQTPALLQFATAELDRALQDLHSLVMEQCNTHYHNNDGKANAEAEIDAELQHAKLWCKQKKSGNT